MPQYLFVATASIAIAVTADDETTARRMVEDDLQDADTHFIRSDYFRAGEVSAEIHLTTVDLAP